MNVSVKTKTKKEDLIKYLIDSQKELIKECHNDFTTKKFKEVIEKLKDRNKSLNGI